MTAHCRGRACSALRKAGLTSNRLMPRVVLGCGAAVWIQPRVGNRSRDFNGAPQRLAPFPVPQDVPMSKFNSLPERALELASQVGDSFKHVAPHAGKWLEAGAKLGVLKTGARVAGLAVKRNPVIAIATAAGAGLLWYAARRRAKQAENGPIEGSAKRVDARRGDAASSGTRRSTSTARKRTRAAASKAE